MGADLRWQKREKEKSKTGKGDKANWRGVVKVTAAGY